MERISEEIERLYAVVALLQDEQRTVARPAARSDPGMHRHGIRLRAIERNDLEVPAGTIDADEIAGGMDGDAVGRFDELSPRPRSGAG